MLPKAVQNLPLPGPTHLTLRWLRTLPALLYLLAAVSAPAVTCTTQAALSAADRTALLNSGTALADAIATQNLSVLQSSLLPAVIPDWESIRGVAQSAGPLVKGGELHWRNGYLLDATEFKTPTDAQFFCTNADSSITVTINLRSLPPGRYALLIADFPGAPLAGQLAFILGFDTTTPSGWKLGGLFAREGALETHDGLYYWSRAREQATKSQTWAAWFSYDTARLLLVPVDFLSSPNLEQLNREQTQLKSSPQELVPFPVTSTTDASKKWRITALRIDTTLHFADLALTYEGTGLTEPIAARAEAIAVMSAFLKLHPELRDSLHGLWAYAETDGKRTFAIEQAMHDIP